MPCGACGAGGNWLGIPGLVNLQKAIENAWKMMENGDLMGFQW